MGTGVRLLGDNNKTLIHRNNSSHKPPRIIVGLHIPVQRDRTHHKMETGDHPSRTFYHKTRARRRILPVYISPHMHFCFS